jgi:hypothetical protein
MITSATLRVNISRVKVALTNTRIAKSDKSMECMFEMR